MATRKENTAIDQMQEDIQSLKFDNERIIKPAIVSINAKLDRDIYATKTDLGETNGLLKKLDERTANYKLVEKIVFGLVILVLVTVISALLALVVINNGGKS